MYLASSCSFGVLRRAVALCQSNPPIHRVDFLPSIPSSLVPSAGVRVSSASTAELHQHQDNVHLHLEFPKIFLLCFTGIYSVYFVI